MPTLSLSQPGFAALATEILRGDNILRFRARGGSMWPFIRDGDVVEVAPVDVERIRCGDVVFCRDGQGRLLAHRVTDVARHAGQIVLLTRGDALAHADRPLSSEQLLGRVVAIERARKRIAIHTRPQRYAGLLYAALLPLRMQLSRARRAFDPKCPGHEPRT